MGKTVTFLQLSQEFGGTRFGPFDEVEIRLGSNPEENDITLPETFGVAAQHVKILKQQDDTYIIAPVERTAAIHFFRGSGGKPKQLTAPVACQSGDSFALVTPEGPRFFLQVEKNPKAIAEAARESDGPGWGINKPNIKTAGLVAEVKRRGFSAVFTTRLGNMWMNAWRMIKTGQIFSPVYIIGGVLMLSGWLFAGTSACGAISMNSKKKAYASELRTCKDQIGVADDGSAIGDPTIADLTKNILEDKSWKDTIQADTELREAFATQLKSIYSDPNRYQWVYKNKGSPYTKFKSALEAKGMPENLVRVLAFSATRGRQDQDWFRIYDSEGAQVCGRGALGLTYRQAKALGLVTLQPDALVDASVAASGDVDKQKALLDETLTRAQDERTYREDMIQVSGTDLQGGLQCLYVDGEDDRDNYKEIADAFQRKLGASRRKVLPTEGYGFWLAARLVMLYAHDYRYDLEAVSFDSKTPPSVALRTKEVPQPNITYALREAGAVMARAAAIPCIARFDKEQKETPPWLLKKPPALGQCAILKAYVEFDRLD